MVEARRVILIAGPTASGKSALAMELADKHDGAIVNADSMQVYDGLQILTARPGPEETARHPHYLYGHVPPEEMYSAARWLEDARSVLKRLAERDLTPILVGGTGLYFNILSSGIAAIPQPSPQVRRHWRQMAAERPTLLHSELAKRDPEGASLLQPGDTQRLARALEVHDSTGKSIRWWHDQACEPPALAEYSVERYLIQGEARWLDRRIEQRLRAMFANGAVAEVEALLVRQIPSDRPVMKAIGVLQIRKMLAGEASESETMEAIRIATRQYAKRQRTWFRNKLVGQWNIRSG